MARKYTKRSRKSGGRYRRRRSSLYNKKKYKSKGFRRAVKRVVLRMSETKTIEEATIANVNFNSQIDGTGDLYPVFPTLALGTGSNARVGEKVLCRGLRIHGVLRWQLVNEAVYGAQVPGIVDIFVVEDRREKDSNEAFTDEYNFLCANNNAPTFYDGDFITRGRPVWSERYRIVAKRSVKMQIDNTSVTSVGTNGQMDNESVLYKPFKIDLKLNKLLNYSYATGGRPQNAKYFMCAGYSLYDGSIDVTALRLNVKANTRMWYKDI